MPAFKVNGGIISDQMLSGDLRYFKLTGTGLFTWTLSNGTVNLPVLTQGDSPTVSTYFRVGADRPVPKSAADLALQKIADKATIVQIGLVGTAGAITEVHFAIGSNSAWDITTGAADMQAAVRSLGVIQVYVGGTASQSSTPITANVDMNTAVVTEVPFRLA